MSYLNTTQTRDVSRPFSDLVAYLIADSLTTAKCSMLATRFPAKEKQLEKGVKKKGKKTWLSKAK